MNARKAVLVVMGVAVVLAGTMYLAPALARPYWAQSADGGAPVPPYGHCYVNGTWARGEDGALQPPCWDPEAGEYVPRYNGTRPDWCPYAGGQDGSGAGGLGGMMGRWARGTQRAPGRPGGMMGGIGGGSRRGGGCGWTG